jgi:hypothetical protein
VNARKTEDYFHSPEQVHGYITQALVLLDAHELTPDERARLLPVVVDKLSNKNITYEQVVPAGMVLPQNRGH